MENGTRVKAKVNLALGDHRIKIGREGEVIGRMTRERGTNVLTFLMVKFGPRLQGQWPESCFEAVENM